MIQGGDDGTGAPTKQGWTGLELFCRLVSIAAGHNDFRRQFRNAANGESVALRNLDLHRFLIVGNEQQRRTCLELVYQLSTHVSALQNVRTFFAVTSFADVPGSRLRKSDLLETVMDYILDREMHGGAESPVTDVQSQIIPSETISGIKKASSNRGFGNTLALPSENYNPATDRITASDNLRGILDRLDLIPDTTTSTPIKVLAGLLVERIKKDGTEEDFSRCACVMEQSGWNWERNVPKTGVTEENLKAGVVRAARLAVQQFPDFAEESLVLRHSAIFDPGNVRSHYGAFSDPAVLLLQEKEMECEALYSNTQDVEKAATAIDDTQRAIKEVRGAMEEAKIRVVQLHREVEADQQVVETFARHILKEGARTQRGPARARWGRHGMGWSGVERAGWTARTPLTSHEVFDSTMETSHEMVKQTQGALHRHQSELQDTEGILASYRSKEASLLHELAFNERQLDLAIDKIKRSGIENVRGSATLDLRRLGNQGILEAATFAALDGIVDAVSRLRKVNRGFVDQ